MRSPFRRPGGSSMGGQRPGHGPLARLNAQRVFLKQPKPRGRRTPISNPRQITRPEQVLQILETAAW